MVYSSPVTFGQGLEWKDRQSQHVAKQTQWRGQGKRISVVFKGAIIIIYMESGVSKEEVRR